MKRTLLIIAPIAFVLGLIYGTYKSYESDIQLWVLGNVERFSDQNLPFRIHAKSFELQFISPGVKLSQITIIPKEPKSFGFQELKIRNVRANLDFLQAIGGRIFLSSVIVDGAQVKIDLDQFIGDSSGSSSVTAAEEKKPAFPWKVIFKHLQGIPVYRLALIRNQIQVVSKKLDFAIQSMDLDMIAFNQGTKLNVKADLSETNLMIQDQWNLPIRFRGDASLTPEKFEFHEMDLNCLGSKIQIHGEFNDLRDLFQEPQGKFEFKTDLALDNWRKFSTKPKEMISLLGQVTAQGEINFKKNSDPFGHADVQGKNVRIAQFDVGDFELGGDYKDKILHASDLLLHHPAGDVAVENLEFEIPNPNKISFKGKVSTEQIDLHDLLEHLNVGDLDLDAFLHAKLDCQGSLTPTPDVSCRGDIGSEQLEIRSDAKASDTIAAVEEFQAKGEVRITNEAISYKSELKLYEDSGLSDGVINYQSGFQISYSSPDVHFKNFKSLAGLKLEGHGKLIGNTSGDSSAAIFSMNLDLKQAAFEDFILGDPKGVFSYEKGRLHFSNLQGTLGSSKYSAKVLVDLRKSEVAAEGQIPALELSDLLGSLERKFKLPVEVTGFGSAFIKVSGPMKLGQLTYNISAQAFRGQVAGESYDRFQAEVSAVKGEVKFEKVFLAKNKSVISLFGVGHPSGQIELTVRGDHFLLEESENISRLSNSISGNFNFQMGLNGHILNPDINLKANLSGLTMEEQDFPNSAFQFLINKKGIEGSANLLGNRLKSEFLIPLSINDPFRLKVQALDWNYATLFALIGGASLLPDYQTSMSGTLDLTSETGGFFKATGHGQMDRFLLKRGNQSLSNTGPMDFNMKSGVMSFSNFKLTSEQGTDQGFLEVRGSQFTSDDLRLKIEGNTPIRLLHLFVPFLEEIGGTGKISVAVTGNILKPEILGSANISNGFIKIKGFPHPFDRIGADVQFSVSKILVNQFSGNLAGGTFKGDGNILIEGPRNLPMNITAHIENASLNVPDGIRTLGDADLAFSGSWFPFLLSGTYRVKGGTVGKEFGDDAAMGGLKQSSYLPKMILQSAFEPLVLDIQAQIDKPLLMKNSLMEGSVTGQIQIKGPPTQPILLGKIDIEKNSKLMFKDKIFDVGNGNVQFKDPVEINPDLYIAARSRVNDYDIGLLVQGTAKAPVIRLSSNPPLNESDIISLLALGVVTTKSDKGQQKDQYSSLTLSALANMKPVKKLQDVFGVNLQLSNSYDDTKNVSVQKITISKKLSEKVNLSASQVQGQQSFYEAKLRYLINNNWSTVGSYETRKELEDTKSVETQKRNDGIFGVDLEFKKEFK